jgi:predicted acyltransferase
MPAATPAARNIALDALRGLTVALMILVNTPGSWSYIYPPLRHAAWHGMTPTDLVFPLFLFIVGAAMAFSLPRDRPPSASIVLGLIRRSLLLIGLGLLLNAYPFAVAPEHLRLPGVLQRIGICYLLAGLMLLYLRGWRLWLVALGLLLGWWVLMLVPGAELAWTLQHNMARRWDLVLLGESHLWQGAGLAFDPEGLLSTVPAVVSVLIGHAVAAEWRAGAGSPACVRRLAAAALAMILLGLLWSPWMPINKSLWTGSFMLISSGIAVWSLLLVDRLLRIEPLRTLAAPLRAYGQNPLLLYVLSWLLAASYPLLRIGEQDLQGWLFLRLAMAMPAELASLCFALTHVLLFGLLAMYLLRRGIVVRI